MPTLDEMRRNRRRGREQAFVGGIWFPCLVHPCPPLIGGARYEVCVLMRPPFDPPHQFLVRGEDAIITGWANENDAAGFPLLAGYVWVYGPVDREPLPPGVVIDPPPVVRPGIPCLIPEVSDLCLEGVFPTSALSGCLLTEPTESIPDVPVRLREIGRPDPARHAWDLTYGGYHPLAPPTP